MKIKRLGSIVLACLMAISMIIGSVGITYAVEKDSYTVTFVYPADDVNADGTSYTVRITVAAGTAIGEQMPADPEVEGKIFLGWISGGAQVTDETVPVKDMVAAPSLHEHVIEELTAVEATCTESGLTRGERCSDCGEILIAQETVEAKGHTEEIIPGVPATDTEDGLTEGVKCSVCGEILVEQEIIPKTACEYGEGETVIPATCENPGVIRYTCIDCGSYYEEELPAVGHTEEIIPAIPATHSESGLTEGIRCSVCEKIIKAQQIIPVLEHEYGEGEVLLEAGCETAGSVRFTCVECGYSYEDELPAKGHTEEQLSAKAATCTEEGLTEGVVCADCGAVLKAQEVISPLGHSGGTATCTDRARCDICGESYGEKAPHSYGESWSGGIEGHFLQCTVCSAAGEIKAHVSGGAATESSPESCTVCGYVIAPALGHQCANHLSEVKAVPATCTEAGNEAYYVCECGKLYKDAAALTETDIAGVTIAAKGHIEKIIDAVPATCTTDGLTEGVICSACSEILTAQKTVAALGHSFSENPVSSENGQLVYECEVCGETKLAASETGSADETTVQAEETEADDGTDTESVTETEADDETDKSVESTDAPESESTDSDEAHVKAPQTGDGMTVCIVVMLFALVGIVVVCIRKKRI